MTYNSMRSFAIGLLIASGMCGAVYFFGPSEAAGTQKEKNSESAEKPSLEEMKSLLASEGYVIQTEAEWNEQLAAAEAAKATEEKPAEKTEEKAAEKIVYRTMLTVSSGMTSIDVGNALERANIIDNGLDFFKEVEKRGVENDLRPGTYDVESGMTMDEIISAIFK